nr:hypothetical protein [Tanacetum cinerariifolium]
MATTIEQQTALDESLVPSTQRTARIAKSLASHMSSKGISQSGAITIGASAADMPRLLVDRRDGDDGEAGGVKRLWRQQVVSEGGGVVVVGGVGVPAALVAVHGDGGWWIL